jgi:citrate synthase
MCKYVVNLDCENQYMTDDRYLSAQEAADRLNISTNTLYSYVSRGLIRSEPAPDGTRQRRYHAEDVERLAAKKEISRDPTKLAKSALDWGAPVLDSAITLISGGHVYYRGHDVAELASASQFEDVAALIWGEGIDAHIFRVVKSPAVNPELLQAFKANNVSMVRRFQVLLPLLADVNLGAYDLRPAAVARTGAQILQALVNTVANVDDARGREAIAERLAWVWCPGKVQAVELINAALILCADHELNASSFAARVTASAGATPYEVVMAGLATLQGVKHGGYTERAIAFLRDLEPVEDVYAAIGERLRLGEDIPGFGHRLYPKGDPRAAYLLKALRTHYPEQMQRYDAIRIAAKRIVADRPTLDFALAALCHVLDLPHGAGIALFALGRIAGWIGHAIEQYETQQLIRPRARYVGAQPE